MSDELSFAEIDGQQVELLPARTVLSLFATGVSASTGTNGADGANGSGNNGVGINWWSGLSWLGKGSASAGTGTGGLGGAGGKT